MLGPWIIKQLRDARARHNDELGIVPGGLTCDKCKKHFSKLRWESKIERWLCVMCFNNREKS